MLQKLIVLTLLIMTMDSFGRLNTRSPVKIRMDGPQDTVVVDADGNRYPIKKMLDGKLWMAANLKVNTLDSYCYENVKENCEQFGRLYTWDSAQKGCRLLGEDWRLPTNDEWQQLTMDYGLPGDSIDYRKTAYKALLDGGDAQFNTLMGGGRYADGRYARLNAHAFFWTATERDNSTAWLYNFGAGGKFINRHNDGNKSMALSVRCIKN